MRHNPGYGIMPQLVQGRPVPVDRLEIRLRRRHLHIVERRGIESAVPADAEVDAGRPDQGLDLWFDESGRRRWSHDGDILRQAVTLRRIEHREPFEERDRGGFLAGLAGAALLVLWRETVGIDDGGAAFAPADIAAERQGLAEGEPALAGKAVLDHRAPEDQHIDPRIMPPGRGVPRHREGRLDRGRSPGLDPGEAACLQLGDDLAGDVVV